MLAVIPCNAVVPLHATRFSADRRRSTKRVSFADERGLDLTSMRSGDRATNVCESVRGSVAVVDASVADRLQFACVKDDSRQVRDMRPIDELPDDEDVQKWAMKFSDPAPDLYKVERRLMSQNVALDSVRLWQRCDLADRWQLSGTVRVKNIEFDKSVTIRVSFNNWDTFKDHRAMYCFTSGYSYISCSSENTDVFWFQLLLPQITTDEDQLSAEFCVLFKCRDCDYWDNNDGANYCLTGSRCR